MALHHRHPDRIAGALDPRNEARIAEILSDRDRAADWTGDEIGAVLERTTSAVVRNAAALALADRGAEGSRERILALVSSPEIAPSAGTLLYAIDRLGGTLPMMAFLNIVEHGSFEARAEAIGLLEERRVEFESRDVLTLAIARLHQFGECDDQEIAAMATESLGLLRDAGRTGADQ